MSPKQPPEGFEALYKRLETTVSKLEGGNLALEESISLYEEGMNLARRCQEILQEAELKVTQLQAQFSENVGVIRDEPGEYAADDEPPLDDE